MKIIPKDLLAKLSNRLNPNNETVSRYSRSSIVDFRTRPVFSASSYLEVIKKLVVGKPHGSDGLARFNYARSTMDCLDLYSFSDGEREVDLNRFGISLKYLFGYYTINGFIKIINRIISNV